MIKKILRLQNVGLLQDATPTGAVDFAPVTIIYSENGRGKSTFAAVMRACQLADAGRLSARRTIDSQNPPEIDFLLSTGGHVEFKANAWTGAKQEIVVFDSEFVEQNVYSGFEVRAEQRQALLEFALGDQTVQLKQHVDQLTQDIESQTRKRTQAEKTLTGSALPYNIVQFVGLQPVPDGKEQIEALQKRIEAAKNVQELAARQSPNGLQSIPLDTQAIFDLLEKQLADVEEAAEAVVKTHLATHNSMGLEDWVSRGQEFLSRDECPFCGQRITGLKLIAAYRSHFNKAYADLKRDVASLEGRITELLADSKIDAAVSAAATNTARIEAWKDQLDITAPQIEEDFLRVALGQVRKQLLALLAAKRQQPLVEIGTQIECGTATATIASIDQAISRYNAEVSTLVARITDFKTKLATDDPKSLQAEIKKIEAALKRQFPEVVGVVSEYQAAEIERKRLEGEKIQTRQKIDALMQTTLQHYQTSINQLLSTFGAEFSIEQLKPTYIGSGEPRTEYALSVRNKAVKLGSKADFMTGHCFATTLSESDKRTLAFSFFVARLKADPNFATKVVVLDDPVSSLDRNRRHQSIRVIAELLGECKQMVILSHDPYFIRDLRERLLGNRAKPITPHILAINRVQNGYSAFGACDIDDICSSDYYRHHQMVADFVDGKPTANTRDVAKGIRPLLEGYYHRRFPRRIPRKLTFGQIIALVLDPRTTGPLTHLRPLAKELGEVNYYAGQFHHDTNPSPDSVPVVDSELLGFARRALNLIYQNG
jgi:wobble nucleotide-excising tRNase